MGEKIKVLLVDDELEFLESMKFWFKSKGYDVSTAGSDEETLKKIEVDSPDIIFMDIVMPGMGGLKLKNKIKDTNKNLPLILMSAYIENAECDKKHRLHEVTDVFCKEDDFSKAEGLLKSALNIT